MITAMILEDMDSKFNLIFEGQFFLRSEMHGVRDDLSSKIDHNAFLINALKHGWAINWLSCRGSSRTSSRH